MENVLKKLQNIINQYRAEGNFVPIDIYLNLEYGVMFTFLSRAYQNYGVGGNNLMSLIVDFLNKVMTKSPVEEDLLVSFLHLVLMSLPFITNSESNNRISDLDRFYSAGFTSLGYTFAVIFFFNFFF